MSTLFLLCLSKAYEGDRHPPVARRVDLAHPLYILSHDFLLLVALVFVTAIPVTWLVMDGWLQEFAYRIRIGWETFAMASALVFVIVPAHRRHPGPESSLGQPG